MELRVKEICKERGLLMEDLASKLGITRITLTRNINGNPTIETLQKIAVALDVEITELFSVKSSRELTALIEHRNKFYKAETLEELKDIVRKIEIKTT
jgi:transcriptional regulator with XRE-family HTH domain